MKLYNPDETNTFVMQFGMNFINYKQQPILARKKRIDTRTKKYGNQRKHNGEMGKYKSHVK